MSDEAALFELKRQLKLAPNGTKRELDWRIEQHELLTGADPTACDLWAPFQDEFITKRLALLSIGESTVYSALRSLEDDDYIFRRRKGGRHNDRMILLNTKQIERDLQDHPAFPKKDMKPVVIGQAEALIPEPRNPIFTPIYEGLVRVVQRTKTKASRGVKAWRAAMVLQRVLWIAELRDLEGEEAPALWSVRDLHQTFGWGTVGAWGAALNFLVEKNLLLETGTDNRTPYLLPNVELIRDLASQSGDVVTLQKENTDPTKEEQSSSKARTLNLQKENKRPPKREQPGILSAPESFSETLPDFHTEREVEATPELLDLLTRISHSIAEPRRITRFAHLPLEDAWATLTFADICDQASDASKATTLFTLARQLDTGARTAMAFHSDEPQSKAYVAVLLGHWLDTGVAYRGDITWIKPSKHRAIIADDFKSPERKELLRSWGKANGPLVIENIAEAGTNAQLRDEIWNAIEAHRDAVKPIVFVGIPGDLSFLAKRLKEDRLPALVARILREFKPDRLPDDLEIDSRHVEARPFDPSRPFA
ncbi:MAG: hypothetical protein J0H98_11855 [Solirubrobacterales bacterium]|nr:hypothetical protein [Solirubrobacterales bacterium]